MRMVLLPEGVSPLGHQSPPTKHQFSAIDSRFAARKFLLDFTQKFGLAEGLAEIARLTGPEWCRRVAGLYAGTGHLFFYRGGLPAQNFASVAKGKHRKILTDARCRSVAVFIPELSTAAQF